MKSRHILTVVSLLSLLLMMAHLTHDVLLQPEGHVKYPIPVVVFVVWLYATLMLRDRIAGLVIMLLAGLISAGMIVIHSRDYVVHQSGGFYFIWTMFALSATGWFMAILAARELWAAMKARRTGVPLS